MSRIQTITIGAAEAGERLDRFLAARFPEHSRSRLQRLVQNGHITLNGQPARKSATLHAGDRLELTWPEERPLTLDAEQIELPVLYEDGDLLVINKPAGLSVHPGAGIRSGTLVNALLGYDPERFRRMLDEEERPGIVHRLDKDTTGVLVVARTPTAKAALGRAFAERQVSKVYLALVHGRLPQAELRVETLIGRHPVHRKKMAVVEQRGKQAISTFRELASSAAASLIEARIVTGRTHQVRVQLQHLDCPVIGDAVYGRRRAELTAERQLLHAWKLAFHHPRTGKELAFSAPIPEDFRQLATQAGLPLPEE